MDSNVEIVAPVVGDIGSCVAALLDGMRDGWTGAPAEWVETIRAKREANIAKMAPKLMMNTAPMDFHSALGALRTVIKERPDAILVKRAPTPSTRPGHHRHVPARKRLDVGTWGVMGIGMGFAIAAAVETGKPVLAVEGDSAFGFSGMEVETICGTSCRSASWSSTTTASTRPDTDPTGRDPGTTTFVPDSRSTG